MTPTLRACVIAMTLIVMSGTAEARSCPRYLGCGCWLATHLGITGHQWRELWLARAWAHVGSPAARGCVNCVAVFSRGRGGHVGQVKRWDANGNPVILSYMNRRLGVREAAHPAGRLIALRQM